MKKIPTIFVRDPEHRQNVLPEPDSHCSWVLSGEGVATRKYDGTCCMLNANGYWKRREVNAGQDDPDGFILAAHDDVTGKRVGWVKVDPGVPENRYHMEGYYGLVASSEIFPLDGTYELCGPKVQGNPEKLLCHTLISHDKAEKLGDVPRTYDGLRGYLEAKDIEGIVFHHPDGRMAKIKKRDFGFKRTP